MGPLFRPFHNTAVRISLLGLVLLFTGTLVGLMVYARTPWARGTNEPIEQPIEFDHRHHSRDEGIDCRYCHDTVEVSAYAGIPPTELCLNCHAQVWNSSPLLAPVRESFYSGRPIVWRRVHRVAEFVYFNHAIHVQKGVGCATCHGRVDLMPMVYQVHSMTMGWCLACHRDPVPSLRPVSEMTSMTWTPPADDPDLGRRLAEEYDVRTRTSCDACHR